jgi:hypothetical protein
MSDTETAVTQQKKRGRPPQRHPTSSSVHPTISPIQNIVGACRDDRKYYGVSKLVSGSPKTGEYKWCSWDEGNGAKTNRWPLEKFSLEDIRARWGGGTYRCWWYREAGGQATSGRTFELEALASEPPTMAPHANVESVTLTRAELRAMLDEAKGSTNAQPSQPQNQMQSIRDTIALVAALKEIVAPPAPTAMQYPPEVRALLEQTAQDKLADAVVAKLTARIPVESDAAGDDEDDEDDPQFESWAQLWELLNADSKSMVYSLVKEHRGEMKALLPLALVKLKELVKEAGQELRAQKTTNGAQQATAT